MCAPQRDSTSCLIELHHQSLHTLNDVLSQQPRQQETEQQRERDGERLRERKKQVKIFIKVKIVTQTADRVDEEGGERGRDSKVADISATFFSALFSSFRACSVFFFCGCESEILFFLPLHSIRFRYATHTHI